MNSTTTWIIRILGLCFVAITIYCCFAPISAAADVIGDLIGCLPCVGDFLEDLLEGMVDTLLWIVSCALGCSCGLLVISLTWLVMRPLIGGGLLLVCLVLGCCAFAIAHQHKANRDAARSFDGDDVELRGKLAATSDESEWALYSLIQFLWFEYVSIRFEKSFEGCKSGLWCATTAGARMSSLWSAKRHARWCLCNWLKITAPVLWSCYLSPIAWKYRGFGGLHNAIAQLEEDPTLYFCSNSFPCLGDHVAHDWFSCTHGGVVRDPKMADSWGRSWSVKACWRLFRLGWLLPNLENMVFLMGRNFHGTFLKMPGLNSQALLAADLSSIVLLASHIPVLFWTQHWDVL